MSARDNFTWKLKCEECGKEGIANVSEEDGAAWVFGRRDRVVESLTEGFIVVSHGSDHHEETIIKCDECGVLAC